MKLTLRSKVRLAIVAPILLWFLSHALFVGVLDFPERWEFWTLLLVVALGMGTVNWLARREVSRFQDAVTREDLPAAKHHYEMFKDFWKGRGSETVRAYGINLLLLEGRYRDALQQLEALDIKQIGEQSVPVRATQIAWCLTQLGESAKALEIVLPAMQQLEGLGPEYAGSGHFVLGVSYCLQGKPDAAVPHLEKAKVTNFASRKSGAFFYLGEAYAAMGKGEEARLAYQQALETLPNCKFGIRALDRIQQATTPSRMV